jgi:FkbM family methyltransferase
VDKKLDLTIEDYAKLDPHVIISIDGREIAFSTPNPKTLWRAQTIREKEPITIEWIGGFRENDILVDVGANVGMYTIISAITRGTRVFAFEPEAQNFSFLMKNVIRNRLSEKVTAWPVALSDEAKFGQMYVSSFGAGGSCNTFDEPVDFELKKLNFPFVQGAVSATLDDLVADGVVSTPTHVKIDVDGFEHKVVRGSVKTLTDKSVRSLLIEINPTLKEHRKLIELVGGLGFSYDPEQVKQSTRKEGAFKGVAEYVFRR